MSIHVCECVHNGRDEYHLRYPGMSKAAAQEIADKINGGALSRKQAQPDCRTCDNFHHTGCMVTLHSEIACTNGDKYIEAPKVVLWRTE